MPESAERKSWLERRNWWKIGFFVMLIAFEFVREIAVLSANSPPAISGNAFVSKLGPFVMARGRWVRLDKGEDLAPSSVNIECSQDRGECLEASVMVLEGRVGVPIVERFPAKFEPNAVSYQNDSPRCASYSVRIDLKLEKVIAVRQRKNGVDDELCNGTERRIEMTLGNGWRSSEEILEGHFVPIISTLAVITKLTTG